MTEQIITCEVTSGKIKIIMCMWITSNHCLFTQSFDNIFQISKEWNIITMMHRIINTFFFKGVILSNLEIVYYKQICQ